MLQTINHSQPCILDTGATVTVQNGFEDLDYVPLSRNILQN